MAVYTVHEPPRRAGDTLAHAERFAFVRDGFSWPAFLFGPLWMLRHLLVLEFFALVLISVGLSAGLRALGASSVAIAFVSMMLALLVGFEASSLRRWALQRRGWTTLGVVAGDDVEAAERRFFDAWVARGSAHPTLPPRPNPAGSVRPGMQYRLQHDVIGLFPEPGARP